MKPTSKKSSGLLGGFDFQPVNDVFSANEVVTLPENEQSKQNQHNEHIRQSSQMQQNEEVRQTAQNERNGQIEQMQQIRQAENMEQMQQPLKEDKPKALKQAKRVQKHIEQGEVAEALQEAGIIKEKIDAPVDKRKSTSKGKEDVRTSRVSVPMSEKERKFVYREARKHGMYLGQYIYTLAVAAAEGKIELEDFLED
nr:MAG TPA: NikA, BACTERIAL CONJUGATION, RELAXASE, DNA [Caudoviricetes sp.]